MMVASRIAGIAGSAFLGAGVGSAALAANLDTDGSQDFFGMGPDGAAWPPEIGPVGAVDDASPRTARSARVRTGGTAGPITGNTSGGAGSQDASATGLNNTATHSDTTSVVAGGGAAVASATGLNNTATHSDTTSAVAGGVGAVASATGLNNTATHSDTTSAVAGGGGGAVASATGLNNTATHSDTTSAVAGGGAAVASATGLNNTATHSDTTSVVAGGNTNAGGNANTNGNANAHRGNPNANAGANANVGGNNNNAGANAVTGGQKIGICHATGSASNPFVFIMPSVNSQAAHEHHQHQEDIIGAESDNCPPNQNGVVVEVATDTLTATNQPGGAVATDTGTNQPAVINVTGNAGGGSGGGAVVVGTTGNGQAVGGAQGQVPQAPGVIQERIFNPDRPAGGAAGMVPQNGVIQERIFIPNRPVTPVQAQAIADQVGGGLGAADVIAMTPEEVGGVLGAAGMEEPAPAQQPAPARAPVANAPSALPQTGDFLPLAGQAALGFGTLLAGAGALLRRMRR